MNLNENKRFIDHNEYFLKIIKEFNKEIIYSENEQTNENNQNKEKDDNITKINKSNELSSLFECLSHDKNNNHKEKKYLFKKSLETNQNFLDSQDKLKEKDEEKKKDIRKDEKKSIFNNEEQNKQNQFNEIKKIKEPGELFDFVIHNSTKATTKSESSCDSNSTSKSKLAAIFIKEIKEIIEIMEEVLYTPPYFILFGFIYLFKIESEEEEEVDTRQKIDESFYEGFES